MKTIELFEILSINREKIVVWLKRDGHSIDALVEVKAVSINGDSVQLMINERTTGRTLWEGGDA